MDKHSTHPSKKFQIYLCMQFQYKYASCFYQHFYKPGKPIIIMMVQELCSININYNSILQQWKWWKTAEMREERRKILLNILRYLRVCYTFSSDEWHTWSGSFCWSFLSWGLVHCVLWCDKLFTGQLTAQNLCIAHVLFKWMLKKGVFKKFII